MHTLMWIVGSSLAMSAIAWVGLVSAALNQEQLKKLLLPLVAFSAGSLLGGALLHLLPEAVAANGPGLSTFLPALGGFALLVPKSPSFLIRGGWGRYQALMANFVSAATIVPGALLAYHLSSISI